jgi:hypothetical protein
MPSNTTSSDSDQSMWTTYRWLIIIGAASAGLLALSLVAYPLAVTLEWDTGRGLIKVLMSVSGCAMMLAWIAGAACRIITGELGGRIDRAEAELAKRVADCGRRLDGLVMPERLGGRLEALEQRADDAEATLADVATAESIMRRVHGNGQVRPLRPTP